MAAQPLAKDTNSETAYADDLMSTEKYFSLTEFKLQFFQTRECHNQYFGMSANSLALCFPNGVAEKRKRKVAESMRLKTTERIYSFRKAYD
jgi:hypothetical protein